MIKQRLKHISILLLYDGPKLQWSLDPCGAYTFDTDYKVQHDDIQPVHMYVHFTLTYKMYFNAQIQLLLIKHLLSIYKVTTPIFSTSLAKLTVMCTYLQQWQCCPVMISVGLLGNFVYLQRLLSFLFRCLIIAANVRANTDEVPGALNKINPLIF